MQVAFKFIDKFKIFLSTLTSLKFAILQLINSILRSLHKNEASCSGLKFAVALPPDFVLNLATFQHLFVIDEQQTFRRLLR